VAVAVAVRGPAAIGRCKSKDTEEDVSGNSSDLLSSARGAGSERKNGSPWQAKAARRRKRSGRRGDAATTMAASSVRLERWTERPSVDVWRNRGGLGLSRGFKNQSFDDGNGTFGSS
jgi:hypothetical protein